MNQEILHDLAEAPPFFAREEDGHINWRPHTVNEEQSASFSVPVSYSQVFPQEDVDRLGKLGETPDTLMTHAFMALEEGRGIKPEGEDMIDFAVSGVCNNIINRLFDEEDQGTDDISASDMVNEFMPQLVPMIERTVRMTETYFPMPEPQPDDDGFIMDASVTNCNDRTVVKVTWAKG